MKIKLQQVYYMPKKLQPGILYVSKKFHTAAHLCACGCKSKIRTPLGSTEWTFKENNGKADLQPSVGNWQLPCQSHYWINNGEIVWADKWDIDQINNGRIKEKLERQIYFHNLYRKESVIKKLWKWIQNLLNI